MRTRLSWLMPLGVVTGIAYGTLTTLLNVGGGGVLVFAAAFGALFGALVPGAAVATAHLAATTWPRGVAYPVGSVIGASVAWAAILLVAATSTTSQISLEDWALAGASTLGCAGWAALAVGDSTPARPRAGRAGDDEDPRRE